jgi:hypothetical protein
MDNTSQVRSLRRLALALWVGGLVAIDFVETPVRFGTKEVDRNQIVAIGRRVFAAINRIEVVLGLVLLPLTSSRKGYGARWLVRTMWGAALAQFALVQPRMRRLASGLDYVRRDPADPRYRQQGRWHRVYVALDVLKLAAGVWAILRDRD